MFSHRAEKLFSALADLSPNFAPGHDLRRHSGGKSFVFSLHTFGGSMNGLASLEQQVHLAEREPILTLLRLSV